MGVGMVPVRTGAVLHLKFIDISLARPHRIFGMAVHLWWYDQAMPVNNAVLWQVVFEMDAHLLALADADDRPQIGIGDGLQYICRTF